MSIVDTNEMNLKIQHIFQMIIYLIEILILIMMYGIKNIL